MVGSLSGCYNNIMVCHMMLALHILWTNNSYNCGMFNIFLQQMAGKAIGPSSFHVLSVFFASWHPVRAWCASGCLWSPRLRGRQFLGVLRMLVETTCPYKGLNIDIIWHDHILFQKNKNNDVSCQLNILRRAISDFQALSYGALHCSNMYFVDGKLGMQL